MEEIIMCGSVQETSSVYPGSVESECADCGAKVWLSPSGQKLVRERSIIIVCPKCALARIEKSPEPPAFTITQEAAQEVKAWKRRN